MNNKTFKEVMASEPYVDRDRICNVENVEWN